MHDQIVTDARGEEHHFVALDPNAKVRPTCELGDQCWVQVGEKQGEGHPGLATYRISSESMPDELMCDADAESTADQLRPIHPDDAFTVRHPEI